MILQLSVGWRQLQALGFHTGGLWGLNQSDWCLCLLGQFNLAYLAVLESLWQGMCVCACVWKIFCLFIYFFTATDFCVNLTEILFCFYWTKNTQKFFTNSDIWFDPVAAGLFMCYLRLMLGLGLMGLVNPFVLLLWASGLIFTKSFWSRKCVFDSTCSLPVSCTSCLCPCCSYSPLLLWV